jgi:hypothetical protein
MNKIIKTVSRRFITQQTYGALRYRLKPETGRAWGGPFNGQAKRCLLFGQLVETLDPIALVETGTFLGTTTEWIAAFQIPVFTIEADAEHFGFSRSRLKHLANVELLFDDTRTGLLKLFCTELVNKRNECVIFYLDAHWSCDLPLREEVNLIFSHARNAVVMIDDFNVPADHGYGYDDYGPDKILGEAYLRDVIDKFSLALFYPTTSSKHETGLKRGSVLIAKSREVIEKLAGIRLIRQAN